MTIRRKTYQIPVGKMFIGSNYPISIQSMTNTDTKNIDNTITQILELENAGCELIRCAVYDEKCAEALSYIKKGINIPLVADVHFNYKLAIKAIEYGADKIRINPGNIGGNNEIKKIADAAKANKVPIRIGSNAGSLSKDIINKYGLNTAQSLVESVKENIKLLEDCNFNNIIISIKSSTPKICIEAARLISDLYEYPLHIGVTEAGLLNSAIIKSSIAIGSLLIDGIGDTIRVSITGNPLQEIIAGKEILKFCGLRKEGIEIISCPTCARCSLDLENIANSIINLTKDIKTHITVAVMGCAVNGPGEAKAADLGIAGGKNEGLLFKHGKPFKKVTSLDLLPELLKMIKETENEKLLNGN